MVGVSEYLGVNTVPLITSRQEEYPDSLLFLYKKVWVLIRNPSAELF